MAAFTLLISAALAMPAQHSQGGSLSPGAGLGPRLAIDPGAVAATSGLTLTLGPVKKDEASPFFGEDRPWDVAW